VLNFAVKFCSFNKVSLQNFSKISMLIGEYSHKLDAKKRVALPAKFRKEIGKKSIITRGLDKCLFVYQWDEWQKVAEALSNLSTGKQDTRNFVRIFLSGAAEVETDSLGRILIPEHLKKYAGLEEKVIIAGVYKRIEIWDEKRWENYKSRIESETDMIAEKLGEIGTY